MIYSLLNGKVQYTKTHIIKNLLYRFMERKNNHTSLEQQHCNFDVTNFYKVE